MEGKKPRKEEKQQESYFKVRVVRGTRRERQAGDQSIHSWCQEEMRSGGLPSEKEGWAGD